MRPWEETFHASSGPWLGLKFGVLRDSDMACVAECREYESNADAANAVMFAAAPQMARALCASERFIVITTADDEPVTGGYFCGECGAQWRAKPGSLRINADGSHLCVVVHERDCKLDAALTAAGLGPEEREEVRRKAVGK